MRFGTPFSGAKRFQWVDHVEGAAKDQESLLTERFHQRLLRCGRGGLQRKSAQDDVLTIRIASPLTPGPAGDCPGEGEIRTNVRGRSHASSVCELASARTTLSNRAITPKASH